MRNRDEPPFRGHPLTDPCSPTKPSPVEPYSTYGFTSLTPQARRGVHGDNGSTRSTPRRFGRLEVEPEGVKMRLRKGFAVRSCHRMRMAGSAPTAEGSWPAALGASLSRPSDSADLTSLVRGAILST